MSDRLSVSRTLLFMVAPALAGAGALAAPPSPPPGAIITMEMRSTVGLLLDEIPSGKLRDQAAEEALEHDASFWIARARRQTRLASYRLTFRSSFYPTKGPLPLPSQSVWDVKLLGKPLRKTIGGHDYVAVDYRFKTSLVSDPDSPAVVETALGAAGGTWPEPLELPADPDLLFERTGYACMDEFEFPPGSVFEENTWYYYDQTCAVETAANPSCHLSELPQESCVDAVSNHVGRISTTMNFKRVPYDGVLAAKFRVGTITNPTGADLAVVTEAITEESAVYYRYFPAGACEMIEGAIGALGWRRLLTFSAVVRNDGVQPIHIGDPRDGKNPWVVSNAFEYSSCHNHYHFSHYGTFQFGSLPGAKKAFCLEDTHRAHNDEHTPLSAIHQSCEMQGIGAGWGDEYNFGLPDQWVDVTGAAGGKQSLTFSANGDQFLCEGQTLGTDGKPVDPLDLGSIAFEATAFRDANNHVVSRNSCAFFPNWSANNVGSASFNLPSSGSFVTSPCARGEVGPLRDCGFDVKASLHACTPGKTVQLRCTSDQTAHVLRICEKSEQLGVGVACPYRSALANAIVGEDGTTTVSFTCPAVRDAAAAGTGGYSAYGAPLLPTQQGGHIRCTGW